MCCTKHCGRVQDNRIAMALPCRPGLQGEVMIIRFPRTKPDKMPVSLLALLCMLS